MEKYQPINCAYYDYIEHYAIRGEKIDIRFFDEKDQAQLIHDTIVNTRVRDGEEFIMLKDNPEIRMDRIVSLNEHVLNQYPSC